MTALRLSFVNSIAVLVLSAGLAVADGVDYVRDVKPVFIRHCSECHGAAKQRGGLRLDTAASVLMGGNTGPALIAGKAGESLLIRAVRGQGDTKPMPPKGPRLSQREIEILEKWINSGAKAPAREIAASGSEAASHWAFRVPVQKTIPGVRGARRVRNGIDRFILARLEKEGLDLAPEADRTTLIRRLSLDLRGLPPSVDEIDAFLQDAGPDAYDRLVDRLLASPQYGERWARHWLDLARYADSNGYSIDTPRSIWKYRDWVIKALNQNMPFDQFTIEQLAGDLLPNATIDQKVATGFHRNTPFNEEGGIDLEQFRIDSIVDRVNTTGAVFLGLTLGCCQCHDHKYDPISQREYYQIFAFLNSADEPVIEVPSREQEIERRRLRAQVASIEKTLKTIDQTTPAKQLAWEKSLALGAPPSVPAEIRKILYIPRHQRMADQQKTLDQVFLNADRARHVVGGLLSPANLGEALQMHALLVRLKLEEQIERLQKQEPAVPTTLVMKERAAPRNTYIHLGGDFLRKGAAVQPGVPAVLNRLPEGGGRSRLDLARWLVDPANPLSARVAMNRFWQHYFGSGLVETENDFGTQGTPPSHPELLDWLAVEFIRQNWNLKAMHRLIVTSATYRGSSAYRPEAARIDPRNRLLARQSRLRLDAEIIRDTALAASGLLATRLGGPSVFPPQPNEVYRFTQVVREWKESTGPDRYRRGLYTTFWRSLAYPSLIVFDAPNAVATCTRRIRSNTPLQSLTLLNDRTFFEFAQALARRVRQESGQDDEQRVRHAFRLCLGREPAGFEKSRLVQLYRSQRHELEYQPDAARQLAGANLGETGSTADLAALTTVARVLLNLDEFITRE